MGEQVHHFTSGILCSISRLFLQFPAAVIEPSPTGERSRLGGHAAGPAGKMPNGEERRTVDPLIIVLLKWKGEVRSAPAIPLLP